MTNPLCLRCNKAPPHYGPYCALCDTSWNNLGKKWAAASTLPPKEPFSQGDLEKYSEMIRRKKEEKYAEISRRRKEASYYMGYVYGLRIFEAEQVYIKNGFIKGLYNGRWYSPRQTARCKPWIEPCTKAHSGRSPHPQGLCGINMYGLDKKDFNTAYGCVALTRGWGKVIEHNLGYRVEKAEVIALFFSSYKDMRLAKKHLHGFVKRGTEITNSKAYFIELCAKLREEALTEIPKKEALHG